MADVQSAVDAGSVSAQDVNAHLLQQQLYTKVTLKSIPLMSHRLSSITAG